MDRDRAPESERAIPETICQRCGNSFAPGRRRRRFCRPACRAAFSRARRRQELLEAVQRVARLSGLTLPGTA